MHGIGMRPEDRRFFRMAASALGYWILVRQINPASVKWFGMDGFTPKPIDCKAKTADKGAHAGLVVAYPSDEKGKLSIERARMVYEEEKLAEAEKCWKEFAEGPLRDPERGYGIETRNREYLGCITLGDKYVYGDYDLYDVVQPVHKRRNFAIVDTMHGQAHMRSPWIREVQDFLNAQFGFEVIQHGGEAQYKDHTNQFIDVFGPSGVYRLLQNEAEIRRFYDEQFEGRKALGKGVRWGPPDS